MNNDDKLIDINKAAELLSVSVITLRRWDKNGKLPAVRIGRHRKYQLSKIESLIEGKTI